MATNSTTSARSKTTLGHDATAYPPDSLVFDGVTALFALWMLAGLFLDGWAHYTFNGEIETFLTPWHAVLYSGFAVTAGFMVLTQLRNLLRGYPWARALPKGYSLALPGAAIFAVSGAADFLWHSTFGFEIDTEALLSPPHLALATGGFLLMIGPLRAAWLRQSGAKPGWRELFPAMLSLLIVFSTFTFFTQFSNAFTHTNVFVGPAPTESMYFYQVSTISYILIPAGLMMGVILLSIRRWRLPPGALTFLLAGNAALMFLLRVAFSGSHWPVLIAALAGGVLADGLFLILVPSVERSEGLRWFAFLTPFLFFLLYLLAPILTGGIWWRIHMWLGAPFLAGLIGLGMSYLIAPPTVFQQ